MEISVAIKNMLGLINLIPYGMVGILIIVVVGIAWSGRTRCK